jgi:hypothetical protein
MGSRLRRGVWAGALAGAAVATGCGGGDRTPTGPATPLPSYLARYPPGGGGAVYFLQWQRRDDSVDGTLTIVAPAAADDTSRIQPVAGELDDRRVALEVGIDDPQQWEGVRAGRRIVFRVESGEESFETLRFVQATLADYRRAVGQLTAQPASS